MLGLGVIGYNLVLNLAGHGFSAASYDSRAVGCSGVSDG